MRARPPGSRPAAAVRDFGLVLLAPGALAVTAAVVAVVAGEAFALPGFALTAVLSGALGGGLVAAGRRQRGGPSSSAPLMAAAWLAAAALAAVPFVWAGMADGVSETTAAFADPVNALFESMSGLTSTGLTVASDASALPRSLQWWRSVLQWAGAIGVLYLAVGLADPGAAYDDHGGLSDEMSVDALSGRHAVRDVWAVYSAYTVASVAAFWAAGMPAWEALNHGLTGIATGGFTVTSDSFQSYGTGVKLVGVVVMVLGSVSFVLHYLALVRRQLGPVGRGRAGPPVRGAPRGGARGPVDRRPRPGRPGPTTPPSTSCSSGRAGSPRAGSPPSTRRRGGRRRSSPSRRPCSSAPRRGRPSAA